MLRFLLCTFLPAWILQAIACFFYWNGNTVVYQLLLIAVMFTPVLGLGAFCLFAMCVGILLDWLYEKSGCIWFPALAHGAINAAGTMPAAMLHPDYSGDRIFGPAPNGLLSGLPILILAAIIIWKRRTSDHGLCRDL